MIDERSLQTTTRFGLTVSRGEKLSYYRAMQRKKRFTHWWGLHKWLGHYYGTPCRLIATGPLNQALIEFHDGTKHITLRYGLRKKNPKK